MRLILAFLVVLIVVVVAGLALIYSGVPNVAAINKEKPLMQWVLNTTMEQSVKRHAKGITTPSLKDSTLIKNGFRKYDQMCASCHGAPGVSRREMAKGLNPEPPSLVTVLDEWKPAELFWIIKNGIKMTGMPAYGVTQTDKDLWSIVAFMRTLEDVTPEQYLAMRETRRAAQLADTTRTPATE